MRLGGRAWPLVAVVGAASALMLAVIFVVSAERGAPTQVTSPGRGTPTPLTSAAPATPTPPAALTWEALRNASYPSDFPKGSVAKLTKGIYEKEYQPGAATKLVIQMADIAGFGFLDNDNATDAAVILVSDPGGSGVFIYLVAVLNKDGEANPVASTLLGDRVAVRGVSIQSGQIVVRMRVRGPTDPMVRLTREVTRTYSLRGNELVLEGEVAWEAPSIPPERFVFDPQRIEITPGSKPASIEGTLKPGQIGDYTLRAEAGQQLRLSVRSQFNNAILSVFGLQDGANLVSRSEYAPSWTGLVPASQDYAIRVVSLAGR